MKKITLVLFLTILTIGMSSFDQLFPTRLKITVINELGNIEEGATVTLYGTEEDYKNEENPIGESQITDDKGVVKFSDLEPKVYYVLAEKDDKNNWGAGVQTGQLEEGKMNKVNIVIE